MSVFAITVTTVTCDGVHGNSCPERSAVVYHHAQSVALRLAAKAGWEVAIDSICPQCQRTGVPSGVPGPAMPSLMALQKGFGAV